MSESSIDHEDFVSELWFSDPSKLGNATMSWKSKHPHALTVVRFPISVLCSETSYRLVISQEMHFQFLDLAFYYLICRFALVIFWPSLEMHSILNLACSLAKIAHPVHLDIERLNPPFPSRLDLKSA